MRVSGDWCFSLVCGSKDVKTVHGKRSSRVPDESLHFTLTFPRPTVGIPTRIVVEGGRNNLG